MSKVLNILLGMILLVISIALFGLNPGFKAAAVTVFKGILLWLIFFVGIALIALGINDLKN